MPASSPGRTRPTAGPVGLVHNGDGRAVHRRCSPSGPFSDNSCGDRMSRTPKATATEPTRPVRDGSTRQRDRAQLMWAKQAQRISRPAHCRVGGGSAKPLPRDRLSKASVLDPPTIGAVDTTSDPTTLNVTGRYGPHENCVGPVRHVEATAKSSITPTTALWRWVDQQASILPFISTNSSASLLAGPEVRPPKYGRRGPRTSCSTASQFPAGRSHLRVRAAAGLPGPGAGARGAPGRPATTG